MVFDISVQKQHCVVVGNHINVVTVKLITDIAMGKTLQIACTVMILVTVTVNMTNAQGEVISMIG